MPFNSYVTACACLLSAIALSACLSLRGAPSVIATNLGDFPPVLGGYTATEGHFPESVIRELNTDAYVYRHYRRDDGNRVSLYIGYYGTAKGGRTSHDPYACLPGAGWGVIESSAVVIPARQPATVNFIRARRDGLNTVMVHWYQTGGSTVTSNGMHQNIERFIGRLFDNRGDGAFVQVTCQVPDDRVTEGRDSVIAFAGAVLNELPRYWPIEH